MVFKFKPDGSIGCKCCIAFNVFIDKNAVVVGEVVDCQLFGRKIEVRVTVVVGEVVDCQLFGRKIEVRVSKTRR